MSELHKFIFEGLPVRGMLVRLTDAWTEVLGRRAQGPAGPYPEPVLRLLGEMMAAGVLMHSNVKFDGALILQVFGDGPVKLAVAEVQAEMGVRATVKIQGEIPVDAALPSLLNRQGQGRCAVTLDPQGRLPGQQPYQGVVPLTHADGSSVESVAEALQLYMRQSEQLDTTLVLAADGQVAAGLLIQRLPVEGAANVGTGAQDDERRAELDEAYNRISTLAASLKREELLTLDADTILRRLFWEEHVRRFEPLSGALGPRFSCTCDRARVGGMIRGLGEVEAREIIAERGVIQVDCDFCGQGYRFDDIDVTQLFTQVQDQPPSSPAVQ